MVSEYVSQQQVATRDVSVSNRRGVAEAQAMQSFREEFEHYRTLGALGDFDDAELLRFRSLAERLVRHGHYQLSMDIDDELVLTQFNQQKKKSLTLRDDI